MPGLVPGIHVLVTGTKDVDGRDKPGHDEKHTTELKKKASTADELSADGTSR
jgi:hypothetical protein